MSSPLTVKRRKLNESVEKVNKPFVSPLKTARTGTTSTRQSNLTSTTTYQPSTHAHTITAVTPGAKALKIPSTKSTPVRKVDTYTSPFSNTQKPDPEEKAAQKALTSLEVQIRTLRTELDTLKQASSILNSRTDSDLEELSQKWKQASQAAAEELFGTVKERVCRMGGVSAWRESEKRKHERSHGIGEFAEKEVLVEDDEDCEFDSAGEELPEEEQEWRKKEKKRAVQEMKDAAEDGGFEQREEGGEKQALVWQEGGGDDDAFTMDMMLRSLNIELDVIGYDKVAQRWSA